MPLRRPVESELLRCHDQNQARARTAPNRSGKRRRCALPRAEGALTLGVLRCGHQAETQVEASVRRCRRSSTSSPTAGLRSGLLPSASGSAQKPVRAIGTPRSRRSSSRSRARAIPCCAANGCRRCARDRGRCERRQPAGARQRRSRASIVRVLRLARDRAARIRRPDRAGAGRRSRLARGPRTSRGGVGRGSRPSSDADIVVFKSNGLAAWDVAIGAEALRLARERGVGTTL